MLKERIQEIFEFTKSESPYRKANKGWINQYIFLDLSPSADTFRKRNEAAKVTLFWSPINNFLSNIFIIIIIGSILVLTSVSFAKDEFDFNLLNNSEIKDIVNVDENKSKGVINSKEIDYSDSTEQQNFSIENIDKSNNINLLDEELKNKDEQIINKKTDKKHAIITENESDINGKIFQNKKIKSNFI